MIPVPISLNSSTKSPVQASRNLYGIFFEDINYSCDGGINANMVNNYSFDGIFFSNEELKAVDDPLRYWSIDNGGLESGTVNPLHPNSRYGRIRVNEKAVLTNLGFNGRKAHKDECAMSIKQGHTYLFDCWLRADEFTGTIEVQVTDENGQPLTLSSSSEESGHGWKKFSCELSGTASGYGKLELRLKGTGTLDLDCVSLMDADYWHKDDPKWRYGKLRKDLIEALADLKPAFMRFPGGCIVEGQLPGNEYNWKDTVGELYERKSNYNLWSEKVPDGGYNQSYQIGFYEYFCLCEDLGMKPLPTLTVGLNCQIRSMQRGETECPNIPIDSEDFQKVIVDNYLDLIEFANGDPGKNEWAALRAKMGHPEPFGLDRIGIGNENYGEVYFQRFDLIEKAIHEKYPGMICILCAGVHPFYEDMLGTPGLDSVYAFARKYQNVIVDEHSYHTPEWFAAQSTRFDNYDRCGAGVYFGEYAANGLLGMLENMSPDDLPNTAAADEELANTGGMRPMNQSNQLDTALGEAAFLTGVERNSDIVAMASYAPLFNLVESDQWNHNLINYNPQTLCLSTNYYVQKMFASYLGTQYLPYEGTLPENIYLSATEDEDAVYLKLVNTGGDASAITVQLPCDAASANGEILQNDDPHVRNALDYNGEAVYTVQPSAVEFPVANGILSLEVKPYSVYALTIKKA